jgi:hypothetical protein
MSAVPLHMPPKSGCYRMERHKAHSPYLTVSSVFASQAGSGALERLL